MKTKQNRILSLLGTIFFVIGAIDPMEGSLMILPGGAMIATAKYLNSAKHSLIYIIAALAITIGVASLFYLSSLGGIGKVSNLSIWWGLTILPYPAGWLLMLTMLIQDAIRKKK